MLKYLSDNLNLLMAKARLTSSELARHIGIPATTIKRIRNNDQANPTITTLLPIAQYFSISLNELIGNQSLNLPKTAKGLRKIPLLSWTECLHIRSMNFENCSNHVLTERQVSNKSFALKLEDHELEHFPSNSILIVEPNLTPETNNFVIVANIKQKCASVRKFLVEIDKVYLKPLIPGLGTAPFTKNYKILGVIVQYKMELRT